MMSLQNFIEQEKQFLEVLTKIQTFIEELNKTHQAFTELFDFDATDFEVLKDIFDKNSEPKNMLLVLASYCGKRRLVEFLIKETKADPNCNLQSKLCPLSVATTNDMREFLLAQGATLKDLWHGNLLLRECDEKFPSKTFWDIQERRGKHQGGFWEWINFLLEKISAEETATISGLSGYTAFEKLCSAYSESKETLDAIDSKIMITLIQRGPFKLDPSDDYVVHGHFLSHAGIFTRNHEQPTSTYYEAVKIALIEWILAQNKIAPLKSTLIFFLQALEPESLKKIISGEIMSGIVFENIEKVRTFLNTLSLEAVACKKLFEFVLENFKKYSIFFFETIEEGKNFLLLLAACLGRNDIVEFLITTIKADANFMTESGICPLLVATTSETRKLLLKLGAMPEKNQLLIMECKQWKGYTFWLRQKFSDKVEQNCIAWFDFLIENVSITATDHEGHTATHYIMKQCFSREARLKIPIYIEKHEEFLVKLIAAGALNNEKDCQLMVDYVFDRESYRDIPNSSTFSRNIARAIVEWIKKQKTVTLAQKKLAIIYSTSLSADVLKEMCCLPCQEEVDFITERKKKLLSPPKNPFKRANLDALTPHYRPIFRSIESLLRNTKLCIALLKGEWGQKGEWGLEQRLKKKCNELKLDLPVNEEIDYIILNLVWPNLAKFTEPYTYDTRGILNSVLLEMERKFGINEDPRSTLFFANFIPTEIANNYVKLLNIYREFKYGGNSFTHGNESHRLQWYIIMRAVEEKIINLGSFTLKDILRESVKVWPQLIDDYFYNYLGFGSPENLHSSLLLSWNELPYLSFFLRKSFVNGFLKFAKEQPKSDQDEITPEKMLCYFDWQKAFFDRVFKVPDVIPHYKGRGYEIDVVAPTDAEKEKSNSSWMVFYKNRSNQTKNKEEIINQNETKPETSLTASDLQPVDPSTLLHH